MPVARRIRRITTGIPPVAGSGSGSFYSDPYSAYPTRLVDPSISSDVAGGTTLTRTWNGVSASYQVYKTIQYAVNDYLTQGGRRIGLLDSTTYTLSADLAYPSATGLNDSARVILQGDPSSTEANMAKINLSNGWKIAPTANGSRGYMTFRKLWVDGQANRASYPALMSFGDGDGASATYDGLVIEYCKLSNLSQSSGASNAGAIKFGQSSSGNNVGCEIRYTKFSNIQVTGAIDNTNTSAVMLEVASTGVGPGMVLLHHCLFDTCATATNMKVPHTGGYQFYRNIVRNGGRGFYIGNAGASTTDCGNVDIYLNLWYGLSTDGYMVDAYLTSGQGSRLAIYQNTIAEDVHGGFAVASFNDIRIHSNAELTSGAGGQYKFKYYGSTPGTCLITQYDRNAYYGDTTWVKGSTYSTLASWKAATGTPLNSFSPDANALSISSLSTEFTNTATRNYSLKAGSQLLGAGVGGVNIGYDWTDCGPAW